jgi:hypothetical protein
LLFEESFTFTGFSGIKNGLITEIKPIVEINRTLNRMGCLESKILPKNK